MIVNWLRRIAVFCVLSFGASTVLNAAPETVVIPIKGEISSAQFYFLRRAVKAAEEQKAAAVIVELDTYGGELDAATKMLDVLSKTKVPTIAYVNPKAGSAGALIALGTKKIYMAPVSAIGAAAPVSSGGEDLQSTMKDKVTSYFSGYFRSAAERNGYRPDLAQAFMDKAQEVKIGDEVVHKSGSLLTLSAQEATRIIGGKPLLATGIADSLEDLQAKEKLPGALVRIEPTGFENLARWLTALAPLLLSAGLVLGYLELKTAGFGLAGIASATCFALFFLGQFAAGLAGWEVAVLFLIGALLVLGELFVHPGTILPGFAGLVLMVGALVWAMVDRYPSDPWLPTSTMLTRPLGTLVVAGLLTAIAIFMLAKYLPKIPLLRSLVLQRANAPGSSIPGGSLMEPAPFAPFEIGATGIALTPLRPGGRARIGTNIVDVITAGDFVEPESALQVVEITGSRIVVQAQSGPGVA